MIFLIFELYPIKLQMDEADDEATRIEIRIDKPANQQNELVHSRILICFFLPYAARNKYIFKKTKTKIQQ